MTYRKKIQGVEYDLSKRMENYKQHHPKTFDLYYNIEDFGSEVNHTLILCLLDLVFEEQDAIEKEK